MNIFETFLFLPVYNLFFYFVNYFDGVVWIAIITLVIIFRIILFPVSRAASREQQKVSKVQGKIQELKKKFKNNRVKMAQELTELYKQHNISPFKSIGLLFIQIPVFIVLFFVFINAHRPDQEALYNSIPFPEVLDPTFFIFNLFENSIAIAILVGLSQYIVMKRTIGRTQAQTKSDFARTIQKQLIVIFPILVVIISSFLGAAVSLYWIINNLFSFFQEVFFPPKET